MALPGSFFHIRLEDADLESLNSDLGVLSAFSSDAGNVIGFNGNYPVPSTTPAGVARIFIGIEVFIHRYWILSMSTLRCDEQKPSRFFSIPPVDVL